MGKVGRGDGQGRWEGWKGGDERESGKEGRGMGGNTRERGGGRGWERVEGARIEREGDGKRGEGGDAWMSSQCSHSFACIGFM